MITRPHRADFHHIVWVRKGRPTLLIDFEAVPLKAGSLVFIRKDRVLMYDKGGDYDGTVLRFTDAFFIRDETDARFLRECRLFAIGNPRPVVPAGGEDAGFRALAELMEREAKRPVDAFQRDALRNLLHNFLILAERRAAPTGPAPAAGLEAGRRFLDLVDAGFRTEKKVSAYARRMGVPEKRLQAATAAAFGKSPKALIDERAALEAKRLLVYGGGSVKEIAFALGFEETTNFVKWFRKHAGTTPAGFRARYLP
jgi:AraC-like DNA-binding protein